MSCSEVIMPYDQQIESWLTDEGYPHPPLNSGNRFPTTRDMKWALEAQRNLVLNYPKGIDYLNVYEKGENAPTISIYHFDWDSDEFAPEYFSLRHMCELAAAVLTKLCERCGQLFLYSECCDLPAVFEAGMNPTRVAKLFSEACQGDDDLHQTWEFFLHALYGEDMDKKNIITQDTRKESTESGGNFYAPCLGRRRKL